MEGGGFRPEEETLDPEDWDEVRALGHRMLDDMIDYVARIRDRPVWQPMPDTVRRAFDAPQPAEPVELDEIYRDFTQLVLPYSVGNVHPRFMGWVHGGGTVVGMLAEMLAGGLNANLGGRDHAPIAVERQIVAWVREWFGFPEGASGLFVTGTSIANFVALLVARQAALGAGVRSQGLAAGGGRLTAYASVAAHGCIARAMEMAGLGTDALRLVPTDSAQRILVPELVRAIAQDRAAGLRPFLIVGTAGTVDAGAVDDLGALAALAAAEGLWFHVDGAYGALAVLASDLKPLLTGIDRAHSIAFDFHKWGQVPYDAGFVLVRDGKQHLEAFAAPAAYLRREEGGLFAGSPWPCDFGPDLSRGFRALKTWFTLRAYGTERLGETISRSCRLARDLARWIDDDAELELAAPVQLNVVCFRYRCQQSDRVNARIVVALHEAGIAVPSTTTIDGRVAIRAAIINHRTQPDDLKALAEAVKWFGKKSSAESFP